MSSDPDLDKFLSQVDEVNDVIRGLTAGDETATERADALLKKTTTKKEKEEHLGFNSSRINKVTEEPAQNGPVSQSKDSWMEEIANDAERRSQARRERKKQSDELKEKGNKKLAKGNFEEAYRYYSEGINVMKDNLALWTNRAQVLVRMERYKEAVDDCDFAFRIDEKCLKAFVHKAKALAFMHKFEDARACLDEALEANPSSKKTVAEYLDLVDEIENTKQLNAKAAQAKEFASQGFSSVAEILEALKRKEQPKMFYIGGLECLKSVIQSDTDRVIFRTEGGFEVMTDICKSIPNFAESGRTLSSEDSSILCTVIALIDHACLGCLSNVEFIAKNHPLIFRGITQSLTNKSEQVQLSAWSLSKSVCGDKLRRRVFLNVVAPRLILQAAWHNLDKCSQNVLKLKLSFLTSALQILEFKKDMIFEASHIDSLCAIMKSNSDWILAEIGNLVATLLGIQSSKTLLAADDSFFQSLVDIVSKNTSKAEICCLYLGLIYNCGMLNNPLFFAHNDQLLSSLKRLFKVEGFESDLLLISRSYRVLKQLLTDSNVCSHIWSEKILLKTISNLFIRFNKSHSATDEILTESCQFASGVLAVLMKNVSFDLRLSYVWDFDPKLTTLLSVIKNTAGDSANHISCANAALILGYLVECRPIPEVLSKNHSNVCKELLTIASNNSNEKVRGNVAIALSRLVTKDQSQLTELRKLGGLKILHDCVKFVDM